MLHHMRGQAKQESKSRSGCITYWHRPFTINLFRHRYIPPCHFAVCLILGPFLEGEGKLMASIFFLSGFGSMICFVRSSSECSLQNLPAKFFAFNESGALPSSSGVIGDVLPSGIICGTTTGHPVFPWSSAPPSRIWISRESAKPTVLSGYRIVPSLSGCNHCITDSRSTILLQQLICKYFLIT